MYRHVITEKGYILLAARDYSLRITMHGLGATCTWPHRQQANFRHIWRHVLMHVHCLHAGDIKDPLKRDVLKPVYERRLMGGSVDSLLSLGRTGGKYTLDTQMWGGQAIHSTPYGHCVDSTGGYVVRPQSVG